MAKRAASALVRRGPLEATLFRYQGKGAWHFAIIPSAVAPSATRPWGRTPVTVTFAFDPDDD